MVTSRERKPGQSPRWAKFLAIAGSVAAVAAFLGNIDKVGRTVKEWFSESKPLPAPTVIVQITVETLLEAASRAAAAASAASGPTRSEALKSEAELRAAAEESRGSSQLVSRPSDSPAWLKIAFGELGQAEVKGPEDNPRIVAYLKSANLPTDMLKDETPWTSAFANWALVAAGRKGIGSANAQDWLAWGQQISTPRLGALVLVKGRSPIQTIGPACFFVAETSDRILCVGGNFFNSVSILAQKKENVHSYRWPSDA